MRRRSRAARSLRRKIRRSEKAGTEGLGVGGAGTTYALTDQVVLGPFGITFWIIPARSFSCRPTFSHRHAVTGSLGTRRPGYGSGVGAVCLLLRARRCLDFRVGGPLLLRQAKEAKRSAKHLSLAAESAEPKEELNSGTVLISIFSVLNGFLIGHRPKE